MKILNIAHRGYSGKFDENTILAFKKAIEYNADGIETDVQLSKDMVPVIIHDETLDRTTNGHGFVKDYTLKELKKFRTTSVLKVQKMKDEIECATKNDEQEIPTLKELLELFASSNLKVLNLELKNSIIEYEGLEEKVLEMIDDYKLRNRVIISSFNHMSLVKIRSIEKQKNIPSNERIVLGALTDSILANVSKYLKDISVECYHPFFKGILNKEYMREIKDNGIIVNPYTVNEEEDIKMVIEAGVDSIITNEVELVNKML